ncbi:NAD-dependent epimerase/dehydratase family protein [Marinomonas profundimaris]|uniref:Epimerase n=1 Tax=Marinomonas profundimaris TaxID=1208321 RepID=W1S2Q9_9GAMM|nr:NAD-dependent epimerase/dehydratase family protein [Marinomonas profundimaris]ETI61403.1 epimerase [Marinomonas profundimaris]
MNIGILGASSQIAKDLILSFNEEDNDHNIVMFSRSPEKVANQFKNLNVSIGYPNLEYADFPSAYDFDVLINFVGVGDPAQAKEMGAKIFEVTEQYDDLAMCYLQAHSFCKYIFMSSGAVYGGDFEEAVDKDTVAKVNVNNLKSTDWYTIAKLYAEAKHRAMSDRSIIDVRVFNYFSCTQDINARFLVTDIVRAIKNKGVLKTSAVNIVRDYITPPDFYRLILSIIYSSKKNYPIDCYTKSPVDKFSLLSFFQKELGLTYEIVECAGINSTGFKENYFSNFRVPNIDFNPRFESLSGLVNEIRKIEVN